MATQAEPLPSELRPSERVLRPRTARRGGWLRGLFVLAALGGLVWFAPDIVGRTELRQRVVPLLLPRFRGTCEIGDASLGWLTPVVLRRVTVEDRTGDELVSVRGIRSSAPLWKLLTDSQSLGEFQLQGVSLRVVRTSTGTNFDETLEDLAATPSQGAARSVQVSLSDCQVEIQNQQTGDADTLKGLSATFTVEADSPGAVRGELQWRPAADAVEPRLTLTYAAPARDAPEPMHSGRVVAKSCPLDALAPLWRAFAADAEVAGELSADGEWQWTCSSQPRWSWTGPVELRRVEVSGLDVLQGDVLRLQEVAIQGGATGDASSAQLNQLRCRSDFAEITADGTFRWPVGEAAGWEGLVETEGHLQGRWNVAEFVRRLPRGFRLRPGTEVHSGELTFDLHSTGAEAGRQWRGSAKLENAAATADGRPLRWNVPIEASFVAHRTPQNELVFERLSLGSEYCTVQGRGSWREASVKLFADLDRLSQDLRQMVDLGDWRLAGVCRAEATIEQPREGAVELRGEATLSRFSLGASERTVWSEPQLSTSVSLSGRGDGARPWSTITAATWRLTSAEDELDVQLAQPVRWDAAEASAPVTVVVTGDLARWQARLRPWVDQGSWRVAGQGRLDATVRYSPKSVEISQATLQLQALQAQAPGWAIVDPQLEVQTKGKWSFAERLWSTPETVVRAAAGTITWRDGQIDLDDIGPSGFRGRADFAVDVGRCSRWRQGDVRQHLLGVARGFAEATPDRNGTALTVDATIEKLIWAELAGGERQGAAAPQWVARWREPELKLNVRGRQDAAQHDLSIEQASVQVDGLTLALQGQTQIRESTIELDWQGQLDYDWDRLSTRLDRSWSEQVQLQGQGRRPVALRGAIPLGPEASLSAARLTGQFGAGWTQGRLCGVTLGAGELTTRFAGQRAAIDPLDLAVGEGRIRLAPQIAWDQPPGWLQLPADRVIDHLRFSPELCSQWLKFLTPALSDAAEIGGQFSLTFQEDALFPVTQFAAGRAAGSLEIHGAQVRPGALALRIAEAVEQLRALAQRRAPRSSQREQIWMQLPEQTVGFRFADGRVTHDRLALRIGEVDLQTRGSVGVDETLQLIAEIPVRDEWLSDERVARLLQGQTLRIPIGGTLRQPQLDTRFFGDLARRAAGDAVERALENQVQKQLDRLIPGLRR